MAIKSKSSSKASVIKKGRSTGGKKTFKISKHGSKTTSTKVADVNSLDLSEIIDAAAIAGKEKAKGKQKASGGALSAKLLKEDQQRDKAKLELEKKQSSEAQSMLDQLELM